MFLIMSRHSFCHLVPVKVNDLTFWDCQLLCHSKQLISAMSRQKLLFDYEKTTIGIVVGEDDTYQPVFLFNFQFTGYISSPDCTYRGFRVKVFLASGGEVEVVVSLGDTKTSSKFLAALHASTHGFIFSHAAFDESLWADLIARLVYSSISS